MRENWQRGFTLIELLVVLAMAGGLVLFASRAAMATWNDYRLEITTYDAQKILDLGERVRRSSIGTVISAGGIYQHVFPELPAESTVADLVALIPSGSAALPATSRFDTPYLVEMTADAVIVTVDIPGLVGVRLPGGASSDITVGGDVTGTRIAFSYLGDSRRTQSAPIHVTLEKSETYEEQIR